MLYVQHYWPNFNKQKLYYSLHYKYYCYLIAMFCSLTGSEIGIEAGGPSRLILQSHVAGKGLSVVQLEEVYPT